MNAYDAIARFYDLEHDGLMADGEMLVQLLKPEGKDVLVLGVGTGRLVEPLVEAGARVWGIDSSVGMLELAQVRLADRQGIRLQMGDVASVQLERWFDGVVVPFDVLTMLESQAVQIEALRRVEQHLAPEGRMVVDVVNPLVLPEHEQSGSWRERFQAFVNGRGVRAFDSVDIDVAEQRMVMTVRYQEQTEDGIVVTQADIRIRWVYRYELEAMMRLAGLAVEAVYGEWNLSAYGEESGRLIMVGKRSEAKRS